MTWPNDIDESIKSADKTSEDIDLLVRAANDVLSRHGCELEGIRETGKDCQSSLDGDTCPICLLRFALKPFQP